MTTGNADKSPEEALVGDFIYFRKWYFLANELFKKDPQRENLKFIHNERALVVGRVNDTKFESIFLYIIAADVRGWAEIVLDKDHSECLCPGCNPRILYLT